VKLISQLQINFNDEQQSFLFAGGSANTWPLTGTRKNTAFMLLKAIARLCGDVKNSGRKRSVRVNLG
jgi:hypothetical protein